MTALERAIQESKQREEKATKGPWHTKGKEDNGIYRKGELIAHFDIVYVDMKEFISASRTWEPKWREMVEAILISLRCIRVNTGIGSQTPQEIANLKHLDLIDAELERLAKEGLGEK